MSLGTSEHQCSKRVEEGKVTNELLTERVKTVNTTNDGACVCEKSDEHVRGLGSHTYTYPSAIDYCELVISKHLPR
jgi:hypothetical protein